MSAAVVPLTVDPPRETPTDLLLRERPGPSSVQQWADTLVNHPRERRLAGSPHEPRIVHRAAWAGVRNRALLHSPPTASRPVSVRPGAQLPAGWTNAVHHTTRLQADAGPPLSRAPDYPNATFPVPRIAALTPNDRCRTVVRATPADVPSNLRQHGNRTTEGVRTPALLVAVSHCRKMKPSTGGRRPVVAL